MKKTLLFVLAGSLLFSCQKNQNVPEPVSMEGPAGQVVVNIGMPETKSNSTSLKDYQINSYQVFVFDAATGKKETDRYASFSTSPTQNTVSVTMTTRTGLKTVYAIVNLPRLNCGTLSALEGHLSDLNENTYTNLVMSGKNGITITEYDKNKNAEAAPQALDIDIKRLASMIQLDAVTVDFRNTTLEGGSFVIQEIYLKNVVGRAPLGVSGNPATDMPLLLSDADHTNYDNWYNKLTKQATGAPSVTYDTFTKTCTVAGVSTPIAHDLFAYPNKTEGDTTDNPFSQRKTRLVIKAHVTASTYASPAIDQDTYYTFDLPVLVANSIYKIKNINITMLGKDDDNDDTKSVAGRITPTITVDPWTGTTQLNYDL